MKHAIVNIAGKHYLEPTNKRKGSKPGRPAGLSKICRYEFVKEYKIKTPVKKRRSLQRYITQCKPWNLQIPGKEGVPIIRSVEDVVHYRDNKKRLIELLYLAGIIPKTAPCGTIHKGQTIPCNGTLHATYDPNKNGAWSDYGGYYYQCENDGTCSSQCSRGKNNHKRSILKHSIIGYGMTPYKLLQLVYTYSVISHRVQ